MRFSLANVCNLMASFISLDLGRPAAWMTIMPRKKRVWKPGRCYHVMLRGIDGRAIFIDDQDRCKFCLLLQEASELHTFRVHAFCLMSNHIHLLLEPLNNALAVGVHRFAMRYAQQFNQRYNKRGYVFQGRFRSILIEDGLYIRRLSRYIHLNPLESGLVARPEDYRWSSYNAYFGRAAFVWLETDRVLSYFGTTRTIATDNFAEFTVATSDASEDLKQIVCASRIGVYGSEEFTRSFVEVIHSKESTDDKKCSIEPLILPESSFSIFASLGLDSMSANAQFCQIENFFWP